MDEGLHSISGQGNYSSIIIVILYNNQPNYARSCRPSPLQTNARERHFPLSLSPILGLITADKFPEMGGILRKDPAQMLL